MNLPTYIKAVGVEPIASQLKITRQTVHTWLNMENVPRPETAHKLILRSGGALTFERIYLPFFARKKKRKK
jgi:hypothetical protein